MVAGRAIYKQQGGFVRFVISMLFVVNDKGQRKVPESM
jgi:hypothetical protein